MAAKCSRYPANLRCARQMWWANEEWSGQPTDHDTYSLQ